VARFPAKSPMTPTAPQAPSPVAEQVVALKTVARGDALRDGPFGQAFVAHPCLSGVCGIGLIEPPGIAVSTMRRLPVCGKLRVDVR